MSKGGLRRPVEWREVSTASKEVKVADFGVSEPRTAGWCMAYQVRDGGPVLHHEMWKTRRKLASTDFGVDIHDVLSKAIEAFGTTDLLDCANLAGAEIMYRKLQLVEHFWDDRALESAAAGAKMPPEEVQAFMGGGRTPSMVAPALLDYVSKELERVSGIKKNARKLREEQAASAKAKAGAGKDR